MRPFYQYEEVDRWIRWGMNDCQVARLTGIPRGTVREWRCKGRTGRRGWGRHELRTDCPLCEDGELPEKPYAYLLGIYLGDGCITPMRRGVFKLRIFQDLRYTRIIEEIVRAVMAVRPGRSMIVGRIKKTGYIEITAHWKHWPCLFPQHGPGRKHLRKIALAPWQGEIVALHPDALLRGLIHSDGARTLNRVKGRIYPRYEFTNHSDDIRRIFCNACDQLGIAWRPMTWRSVSIARRHEVAKLDRFIGPKH